MSWRKESGSYKVLASPREENDMSEIDEVAVEAYYYLYPLILMDVTRKVMTNVPPGAKPGMGPVNIFHHIRAFPPATFREVVRPNFDTLYSSAWLDLTKEPMIVSAADTGGRYYLLPMLDMWTDVFASPGKRTSGTGQQAYAVVPKGWEGTLPEGVGRIDSPTPYVWIIGRTQTNGPADYQAVNTVQDGYRVTPLSQWGKAPKQAVAEIDPSVDLKTEPLRQVESMSGSRYFEYGASLLQINPPHVSDWSQLVRLKRLGIEACKRFDASAAPASVKAALNLAVGEAPTRMKIKLPTLARVVNGWQMNTDTMGVYGNYYLKRAIVALIGLGANQPEDAVYPLCVGDAAGQPLNGTNKYVLHFGKDELPPVEAFWSVTMYDAEGYQVANALDRFAIGDRDQLKYNRDGSLDLYLQHDSPGADKEANWLPAPAQGALGVTMRLYAPKAEVLDGHWNPPAIRAAN